jgi:hypothetical protein
MIFAPQTNCKTRKEETTDYHNNKMTRSQNKEKYHGEIRRSVQA